MGFRIWAHGSRGYSRKKRRRRRSYHEVKNHCLDQSDFEPSKLLSMLPSSPNMAGVVKKAVGSPTSHIGGTKTKGIYKIAEIQFAHMVISGINFLAMHGQGGRVSVYCHEKNKIWVDANSFVNCYLSGSNPGRSFIKRIGPGLKKTGLNNFGVLAEISRVLSEYEDDLPNSADAFLRIEIRH